jgi:hypothetical protein
MTSCGYFPFVIRQRSCLEMPDPPEDLPTPTRNIDILFKCTIRRGTVALQWRGHGLFFKPLRYFPNTPFQGGITIDTAPCVCAWHANRINGLGSEVSM